MQRPQVRNHSGRVHQPGGARRHPQLGRSALLQAPAKDQGAVSGPAVPSGRQRKEQTAEALRQHMPLRRRPGCIRSQRRWNCQGKLHWVSVTADTVRDIRIGTGHYNWDRRYLCRFSTEMAEILSPGNKISALYLSCTFIVMIYEETFVKITECTTKNFITLKVEVQEIHSGGVLLSFEMRHQVCSHDSIQVGKVFCQRPTEVVALKLCKHCCQWQL